MKLDFSTFMMIMEGGAMVPFDRFIKLMDKDAKKLKGVAAGEGDEAAKLAQQIEECEQVYKEEQDKLPEELRKRCAAAAEKVEKELAEQEGKEKEGKEKKPKKEKKSKEELAKEKEEKKEAAKKKKAEKKDAKAAKKEEKKAEKKDAKAAKKDAK